MAKAEQSKYTKLKYYSVWFIVSEYLSFIAFRPLTTLFLIVIFFVTFLQCFYWIFVISCIFFVQIFLFKMLWLSKWRKMLKSTLVSVSCRLFWNLRSLKDTSKEIIAVGLFVYVFPILRIEAQWIVRSANICSSWVAVRLSNTYFLLRTMSMSNHSQHSTNSLFVCLFVCDCIEFILILFHFVLLWFHALQTTNENKIILYARMVLMLVIW